MCPECILAVAMTAAGATSACALGRIFLRGLVRAIQGKVTQPHSKETIDDNKDRTTENRSRRGLVTSP